MQTAPVNIFSTHAGLSPSYFSSQQMLGGKPAIVKSLENVKTLPRNGSQSLLSGCTGRYLCRPQSSFVYCRQQSQRKPKLSTHVRTLNAANSHSLHEARVLDRIFVLMCQHLKGFYKLDFIILSHLFISCLCISHSA